MKLRFIKTNLSVIPNYIWLIKYLLISLIVMFCYMQLTSMIESNGSYCEDCEDYTGIAQDSYNFYFIVYFAVSMLGLLYLFTKAMTRNFWFGIGLVLLTTTILIKSEFLGCLSVCFVIVGLLGDLFKAFKYDFILETKNKVLSLISMENYYPTHTIDLAELYPVIDNVLDKQEAEDLKEEIRIILVE